MRLRFFVFALLLFISGIPLAAQPFRYRICFADKLDNPYSLAAPTAFLSMDALQRRGKSGIAVDSFDLPLTPRYVDSLRGRGGVILAKSKWMNSVVALFNDTNAAMACAGLPFVKSVQLIESSTGKRNVGESKFGYLLESEFQSSVDTGRYAASFNQVNMLNGTLLQSMGYNGAGVKIAVLDAGFTAADFMQTFKTIRDENRMHAVWNFVSQDKNVFQLSTHGTLCLSTMASNYYGQLIGTAPMADYYLFVSEESSQENPVEEDYWAAAAEVADSIGADVITTSLGYTTYDDAAMSHTYAEMDGRTTFVSKAANVAFTRGMLVFASAGNEGGSAWHYIGAPADADEVIAVGAVNASEQIAAFSSLGPASDGDIKPNVCAKGESARVMGTDDIAKYSNGTSFACPILAGMASSFWSAFPDLNHVQMRDIIQRSASMFSNPDSIYGYGIPDFYFAYYLLSTQADSFPSVATPGLQLFPNPFQNDFSLSFFTDSSSNYHLDISRVNGQKVFASSLVLPTFTTMLFTSADFPYLPAGVFIVTVTDEYGIRKSGKLIKY